MTHDLDQWLQKSEHGPGFMQALEDKPDDPLIRLQFADALDEAGFSGAAAGMRWAARHGKRPMKYGEHNESNTGGWFHDYLTQSGQGNVGSVLDAHYLPHSLMSQDIPADNSETVYGGRRNGPFRMWTRSAFHGTRPNERDFLHAANQVQWNEEGEPIE